MTDKHKFLGINFFALKSVFVSLFLTGAIIFGLMQTENTKPLPQMENPRIVIKKEKRELQVFDGEKLIKTYAVVLGFTPEGDKKEEGDGKTPEGEFPRITMSFLESSAP